jgi:hypothetical protein
MKRVNFNLYPRDGYFFQAPGQPAIRGRNWPDVIVRLTDYRKRNGMPPGNPEDEVHAFACEKNPAYCSEVTDQQREQTRIASLKGRVLAWLANIRDRRTKNQNSLDFVDETEAKRRADICLACPKNTSIADGCSSCKAAVKESRRDLLGPRQVRNGLNGCLILGEDLPVSTFLDDPAVENGELPAQCWRKRSV